MPYNLSSGAPYNGINVLILWMTSMKLGFSSDAWLTFKQAKDLGGSVRRGEKGVKCVFFKPLPVEPDSNAESDEDVVFVPCRRIFTLFNLDQVDGLATGAHGDSSVTHAPDHQAQAVIDHLNRYCLDEGIETSRRPDLAGYSVMHDSIVLPPSESFESPGDEAVTFAHEVVHATGHPSRLDRLSRDGSTQGLKKGSKEYAFEELIAELGASFISAQMGVEGQLTQHASYIDEWLQVLGKDKTLLPKAAAAASKAQALIFPASEVSEEDSMAA